MQRKERIFHAVSFEVLAAAIIVPVSAILMQKSTTDMLVVSIGLSFLAVMWNYVYNIWFDKLLGSDRINRTLAMRIVHATGFEGGLLVVTLPMVSWYLSLNLIDTMMLEGGVLLFFFVYTGVFNCSLRYLSTLSALVW
ncbi:PACE efflux transporter [Shewanella phaeophyticola]|uniref:PACE efflux transporter n=1 Tax=Shewanella phaeophyticola TaxID=2978345 RepID=A0ABT2P0Z7_9GAMM|nr:PACE efflux transporter [Shewanella sp. KJ10-1]MCT8986324.1 PACE efflux transporter [Shewanella sp. KJ10-1]